VVDAAVIFDVDGVLLELTRAEEDCFFRPFEVMYGLTDLSRDWDSYRIRNYDDIIAEILQRHLKRSPSEAECDAVRTRYLGELAQLEQPPVEIAGASEMVKIFAEQRMTIGVATANLLAAARHRLERAGMWSAVASHAVGADGGGHKRGIVARAVASTGLKKHRIVYVGDSPNDVRAGLDNGVYFVGYAQDAARRRNLVAAGARIVLSDHRDTLTAIQQILS
jgi:beta-phosphoglucomutase-like phosphatase (HAD superfamily)